MTVLDALASRVQDLLLDQGPRSILDVDQAWADRVRAIVGPDEALQAGVGLAVLWSTAFAEVLFDYDDYLMAASGTYGLLRGEAVDAVTADAGWMALLFRGQRGLVSAEWTRDPAAGGNRRQPAHRTTDSVRLRGLRLPACTRDRPGLGRVAGQRVARHLLPGGEPVVVVTPRALPRTRNN
jgi:hypothetical protein